MAPNFLNPFTILSSAGRAERKSGEKKGDSNTINLTSTDVRTEL